MHLNLNCCENPWMPKMMLVCGGHCSNYVGCLPAYITTVTAVSERLMNIYECTPLSLEGREVLSLVVELKHKRLD